MKDYVKVGFKEDNEEGKEDKEQSFIGSIPNQVKQYWMEVPAQYRLLYLLTFLYCHQD